MSLLCRLIGHRHALTFTHDRRLLVCTRCSHVEDDGPCFRPEQAHAAVNAQARQAAHDARIVAAREQLAAQMAMPRQDTRTPLPFVRSR